MTASKYRNRKTTVDGIVFDSAAEAKRYSQLKLLQRAGEITGLTLQPVFTCVVGGVKVCNYIGDFAFFENNKRVVEDVKGMKTDVYKLKKRLVEALNPGMKIVEIGAKQRRVAAVAPSRVRRAA